ncbi:MAG: hypothetical protein ABI807_01855 [Sporichthyaceae bacterium]
MTGGRWLTRSRRLAVLATAAAAMGLTVPASSAASCVGPQISAVGQAAPTTPTPLPTDRRGRDVALVAVAAGGDLTVTGRWFLDGCNDTSSSTGCSGPTKPLPQPAARHVALVVEQDGHAWTLGYADASGPRHGWRVRWEVALPVDLAPGPATLTARGAEAPVVVTG